MQRGYEQITKALNILVKNHNVELVGYRSCLLNATTVFQITFLEDVLSVTNGLCLLLVILEEIKEDVDSIYFQKFQAIWGYHWKSFAHWNEEYSY